MNNVLNNNEFEKKRVLRTYLANNGWQEIITYSLVSQEMKERFKEITEGKFYELLMPKSEYHNYYRQTLVSSHLKTIKYNLSHGNKNLFFFEISSVASSLQQEDLLVLSGIGKLVNQPLHQLTQEIDFYGMKGVLENIFQLWQIESKVLFSPATFSYLHSSQSAEILLGKEKIGFLGNIRPQTTHEKQISRGTFVAQISLSKIFNYLSKFPPEISYLPVSNFPISEKDLSFIIPENTDYSKVVSEIRSVGGKKLQEVNMFDVYRNTQMKESGQKSVSFHLIFQSPLKTLENKEIEEIINNISKKVEKLFAAKLRG